MKQLGLFLFLAILHYVCLEDFSHTSVLLILKNQMNQNSVQVCFWTPPLAFWSSRIGERPRNLQLLTSKQSDSPVGTVLACALRNTGLEHYLMGSTLIVESCNMSC